jgi:hypothetical protein
MPCKGGFNFEVHGGLKKDGIRGIIRYHGAPADLRDIPLGTMLHGRFYLPPDPLVSSVPVVKRGTDTHPPDIFPRY